MKACKKSVDDVMRAMADATWDKVGCFAVMVLDAVRLAKNLTVRDVKDGALRGSQPTASPWGVVRSMRALSPKLCLEGIP